jgi:hypothetical protein
MTYVSTMIGFTSVPVHYLKPSQPSLCLASRGARNVTLSPVNTSHASLPPEGQ